MHCVELVLSTPMQPRVALHLVGSAILTGV